MNEKAIIFNLLKKLAIIFGQEIQEIRLKLYVETLVQYDLEAINKSIELCARNHNFFPSLKQIIDYIAPPIDKKDQAIEMAGSIIECISRFGRYQPGEVQKHVGPQAWRAVEMFGGWACLCDTGNDNIGIVRAQLRDICSTVISTSNRSPEKCKLNYEKNNTTKLLSAELSSIFKN